jgi:hypothetical protein
MASTILVLRWQLQAIIDWQSRQRYSSGVFSWRFTVDAML